MSRVFEFKLSSDRDSVLRRLQTLAQEHDMKCEGDASSGCISGKGFHCKYQFQNDSVLVTLEKKPWVVPWSLAEKEIAAFFQADRT